MRDKARNKLKNWKEKSLSKVGKEVLIKTVAQAILIYVMSCFLILAGLCEEMGALLACFGKGKRVMRRESIGLDGLIHAKASIEVV